MKIKLTKQTHRDLADQFEGLAISGYVFDHDDQYLYVREWAYETGSDVTSRYKYTVSGEGKVTVDKESREEVIRDTNYQVVSQTPMEKRLEKMLESFAAKFTASERQVNVIKQFDEESMTVVEPLYIAYGEVDGQGDAYKNEEAVYQLVKELNEANEAGRLQPSLFHLHKTKTFSIGRAYVNEEECMLGDHIVPRLQPLVDITFKSTKAFEARKEGRLCGLSIGALGTVEIVKNLLAELREKPKAKRLLSNFSFAHKGAHLAYTDPSVGGAASLKNDFYLVKDMAGKKVLNKTQEETLADLEEEFVELDKKLFDEANVETTPSTSDTTEAVNAGVDNENVNKGKESDMSEELQKQIAELEKKLALKDIEVSVAKYELGEDKSAFSEALVTLDEAGRASVLKALDSVIAASDAKVAEVTTAKEAVETELAKAKENPAVQNELAKQLSQEQGQAESQTPSTAGLTLAQKLSAANAAKQQ